MTIVKMILSLPLLSALLWGCGARETIAPDTEILEAQYAYFPLRIGRYTEYSVDSIVYDFATGGGTQRSMSRTFVREQVIDTLRDNTGALQYRIERYERRDAKKAWQLVSVGTAARNKTQAIRTENNLRFLSLVFPLNRRSEWNGLIWLNADREIEIAGERMRPFSNWRFEVDSIDVPQKIGSFQFDSVLVVTEADDTNIIERRFSKARYAMGVGLVSKEQLILDSQYCNKPQPPSDCATKPWVEKAEKGYILKQTILEYN
jgi:hypothetical protein